MCLFDSFCFVNFYCFFCFGSHLHSRETLLLPMNDHIVLFFLVPHNTDPRIHCCNAEEVDFSIF